jgi:esterase/lipase
MKNTILLITLTFTLELFCQNIELNFFGKDSVELFGTLSIPNSSTHKNPLIIFVHGSGPNDRNQTAPIIGGNAACLYPDLLNDSIRNFKDIAEFLSSNGYATFRFDKRTFTYGNSLNVQTISPLDFIEDVDSAINFIKKRPEIDTNCIILLGHSKGGTLIPYIANNRNDIKKLIFLATPSTPIDTLFSQQIRDLYYTCAFDTLTGNNLYNQSISVYNQIRNNTWNMNTPVNGAYPLYWKDWINLSDSVISTINSTNLKSLFIFGNNDFNVPSTEGLKFENLVNTEKEIYYFDNTNHFLTDSLLPFVKNEILDNIIEWLDNNKCVLETSINQQTKNLNFKVSKTDCCIEILLDKIDEYDYKIVNYIGQVLKNGKFVDDNLLLERYRNKGLYFVEIRNKYNETVIIKLLD